MKCSVSDLLSCWNTRVKETFFQTKIVHNDCGFRSWVFCYVDIIWCVVCFLLVSADILTPTVWMEFSWMLTRCFCLSLRSALSTAPSPQAQTMTRVGLHQLLVVPLTPGETLESVHLHPICHWECKYVQGRCCPGRVFGQTSHWSVDSCLDWLDWPLLLQDVNDKKYTNCSRPREFIVVEKLLSSSLAPLNSLLI